MTKRRKFGLGEYPNALTSEMAGQVRLDSVQVDWFGDGKVVNVYFLPLDTSIMIELGEIEGKKVFEALPKILLHLSERVVDPKTGDPVMNFERWMKLDKDLVLDIVKKISGIDFGVIIEDEENKEQEQVVEEKADQDPN